MEILLFPPDNVDEIPEEIKNAIKKLINKNRNKQYLFNFEGNIYWKKEIQLFVNRHILYRLQNLELRTIKLRSDLRNKYPKSVPINFIDHSWYG
jgi:hypothetical protein